MENKQSTLADFNVQNKLGQGAFGQVYKVKRKADGKEYALKKVKIGSMKPKQRDNALNEIRILASYEGEYIIGYKEAFFDQISNTLCIVMQFAGEGDLLKKTQIHTKKNTKFPEQQIWKALVHMTKGLKSLHDRKILHRDLKCANIFISSDGTYKLGDLNVSKVLKKQMAHTQTGTPYYASPQVWKDKPYGVKSDMWSLGCVLYEMAALKPPFTATDLQGLYRKVCTGYFSRIPLKYSNELETVIRSLLKINPNERPTVQQLLSNPIVHKNFNGEIDFKKSEEEPHDLLKTIKYDPRNVRGLKKILPKANYEKEQEKMNVQDMRGGIASCKVSRKESEEDAERRLKQFIQKRKLVEEKQRQKQLKMLHQEKQQLVQKRERVLSACGVRRERYISEQSPKNSRKVGSNNSGVSDSSKKNNNLPKLPPKPIINSNVPNYRLPPKPHQNHSRVNGSNRSIQINHSRQHRPNSSRQKSKENLRNIGQKIVSGDKPLPNRIQRSNSAQKVVYPNWWC